MSLLGFVVLLIVAGICGSIGRAIGGGYSHLGCLGSVALGFIGAILGMWIARAANLPHLFVWRVDGESFPILWSIAGSAIFVGVLGLFRRRGRE